MDDVEDNQSSKESVPNDTGAIPLKIPNTQNQEAREMKKTLEMLPGLQQKIMNGSMNVTEIESMLSRFDPAMLDPLMEILQYLQQKQNRQNTTDGKSTGSKDGIVPENGLPPELALKLNGVHRNGSTNSDSNSVGNGMTDIQNQRDNHMNQFILPNQMLADKTLGDFASNQISPETPHDSMSSQPFWHQRSEDNSRDNNNKLKRSWSEQTSPGAVDVVDMNPTWQSGFGDDGPADVFNFSPTSQDGAPGTEGGRVRADMVSIKEEPMTGPEEDQVGAAGCNMVTISGRNRGLGKANEPKFVCQICGDVAAGFHCGAYVCEACKKFYLRCLKSGGAVAFTCPKDKTCPISRETRSHCQFCRYKKCIDLGMYKPGRDDSRHLRVDFKSIPCKVCAAPSSGFHFGAITCEGCKGFFRRMVKEKLHKKFVCMSGGQCDVASSNRTSCKACRYHKCVGIGMALQGTRLGRQSNSVKRSTLIEYQKRHGMSVALFPKLGEQATDQAQAKVEQLLQSKAPEIQLKAEPEDDGYYGNMPSSADVSPDAMTSRNNGEHSMEPDLLPNLNTPFAGSHSVKTRHASGDQQSHMASANSRAQSRYSSFDSVNEDIADFPKHDSFLDEKCSTSISMERNMSLHNINPPLHVNSSLAFSSSQSPVAISSLAQSGALSPGKHAQQRSFSPVKLAQKQSVHTVSSPGGAMAAESGDVMNKDSSDEQVPLGSAGDIYQGGAKPVHNFLRYLSEFGPDSGMSGSDKERLSAQQRRFSMQFDPGMTAANGEGGMGDNTIPFKRSKSELGGDVAASSSSKIPHLIPISSVANLPHPTDLRSTSWQGNSLNLGGREREGGNPLNPAFDLLSKSPMSPPRSRNPRDFPSSIAPSSLSGKFTTAASSSSANPKLPPGTLHGAGAGMLPNSMITSPDAMEALKQAGLLTGGSPYLKRPLTIEPAVNAQHMDTSLLSQSPQSSPAISQLSPPYPQQTHAYISAHSDPRVDSHFASGVTDKAVTQKLETMDNVRGVKSGGLGSTENIPGAVTMVTTPASGGLGSPVPQGDNSEGEKSSRQRHQSAPDKTTGMTSGDTTAVTTSSTAARKTHPDPNFQWDTLDDPGFMATRILEAYRELENLSNPRAQLEQEKNYVTPKEQAWYAAYESFMHHAKYTLRFVKKIPGFKQLPLEDQVTLVREAVYPITLLYHSQFFDSKAIRPRWFCNTEEEREKIWHYFPKFKELNTHIVYSGMLFRELQVTRDEYAFLCATMVFSSDNFMVKDTENIKKILNGISKAMVDYLAVTGQDPNRVGMLILRLSELKRANYEHTQIAIEVQEQNPEIDFSELWREMFLSKF